MQRAKKNHLLFSHQRPQEGLAEGNLQKSSQCFETCRLCRIKERSSAMAIKSDEQSLFRKIIGLISVEPFVLCWVLPSCILIVAMENLNLEKSCRVNLGLSSEICDNMINKTIHDINCAEVDLAANETSTDPLKLLARDVCSAETESQKLLSVVFGLRAPIAAIFPLIIVLFAGGWSDKKGIRKPLVLFPILGERHILMRKHY